METNTDKVLEMCRAALQGEGDSIVALAEAVQTIESVLAQKKFLFEVLKESCDNMEKRMMACEASLKIRDRSFHADYWILYPRPRNMVLPSEDKA